MTSYAVVQLLIHLMPNCVQMEMLFMMKSMRKQKCNKQNQLTIHCFAHYYILVLCFSDSSALGSVVSPVYSRNLLSPVGNAITMFITLLILGFSIWGVTTGKVNFETEK